MTYLTIKTLHILCVMLWVSGMMLQILLLYAGKKLPDATQPETLSGLRLLHNFERMLTAPAMLIALASGIFIAINGGWFAYGWLFVKIALVVLLAAIHGLHTGKLKRMFETPEHPTHLNSQRVIPVVMVAVLLIVFLVVAKPF